MARRRTEKAYEMHEINLPADLSCAYLIPISDLHIGDPVCNLDKFYRYRSWIEKTPNAYVILNGDILDAATKNSIGDVYGATMQPGEQLNLACEILEPIKDRILALISGNHENRIKRETGIDVSQILAQRLGTWYAGDEAYIKLRLGSQKDTNKHPLVYTIYCTHGWGSGRTAGAKVNNLQRLGEICLADIYIASHTHFMTVHQDIILVPDLRNNQMVELKRTFVSSGAFVGRSSYAVRSGYKFSKQGSPRIRLEGREKKDVHASI